MFYDMRVDMNDAVSSASSSVTAMHVARDLYAHLRQIATNMTLRHNNIDNVPLQPLLHL